MDARFSLPLACCLLAVSLASTAATPSESEGTSTGTNPFSLIGANTTTVAPISNQAHSTDMAASLNDTTINSTVSTTIDFTSSITGGTTHDSAQEKSTFTTPTAALTESTNKSQTSRQTPTWNTGTDTTFVTNTVPGILPSTEPNTKATATTVTLNSTSTTPPSVHQSTEDSHHTTSATLWTSTMTDTMNNVKKGLGMDDSEKALTVVFSGVLGVFVLGLVMYKIIRCKQRRKQYSHQPLSEDNVDGFLTEDTLVISGGLYDGHNIYEPSTTTEDDFNTVHSQQTQFRLEFLSEKQ